MKDKERRKLGMIRQGKERNLKGRRGKGMEKGWMMKGGKEEIKGEELEEKVKERKKWKDDERRRLGKEGM